MKENGGPAFPIPASSGGMTWQMTSNGMSMRDYFAAAALTGYRCAYHRWYQQVGATGEFTDPAKLAEWAYADADAMLAERRK